MTMSGIVFLCVLIWRLTLYIIAGRGVALFICNSPKKSIMNALCMETWHYIMNMEN